MTDAEIIRHLAEKVMGWNARSARPTVVDEHPYTELNRFGDIVRWSVWGAHGRAWNPLESIADAWEAQAMFCQSAKPHGAHFVMGSAPTGQTTAWLIDRIWSIGKQQNEVPELHDPAIFGCATSDTIPRAICLAIVEATR